MTVGVDGSRISMAKHLLTRHVPYTTGTCNEDVDEEVGADNNRTNVALAPPSDDESTIDPVDMMTSLQKGLYECADSNGDLGRSKCLIGGIAEDIGWCRSNTNGTLASQTALFFLHVDIDERRSNTQTSGGILISMKRERITDGQHLILA
ncbi:Os05g0249200 [Oryza sativa Japonica Group]|uniref:Uncharacterized protein n=3 Tax=Oryza sativa TaxID=4530 RepID=A0A8J8YHW7_ORYSJ|nr:hypothetical protein OsI_19169 [Oryza sativa Indica Group]EEE62991.1 hypothetical protein OsJ_17799 [Oryza sativa Japonica Group]BAS93015.1 Os05g0249200 [Oryza sativa Japonica Group]